MNIQSLLNGASRLNSDQATMFTTTSSVPTLQTTATTPGTTPMSTTPPSAPEPIILAPHLRGHRSPISFPSQSPPNHPTSISSAGLGHSPPLKRPLSPDHRHDDLQQRSPPYASPPLRRPQSHSPTISYHPKAMPIPSRASHSPPVRNSQQSPYMGLEALVQAATQEQRRMEASERAASHSPVVDRPPASVSRSPEGSHSSNTRSLVPLDVTPRSRSPPPPKKQRRSDSPPRRSLSGPGVPIPRDIVRQSSSSSGSAPKEQDAHEWLLEHYASPPADTPEAEADADATDPEPTPADDMEVDDELLSLVEPVQQPPPQQQLQQRYPFAAPPPVLRISKPLMPTVVTTIHSPTAFPVPSPLGPGPGPMPPPPQGSTSSAPAKAPAKSKSKKSAPSAAAAAPPPKPKPAAKSRAKPKPKAELKAPSLAASALKKSSAAAAANTSRSRSASQIPVEKHDPIDTPKHNEDVAATAVPEKDQEEDDKLYCVCKTRYDEDRVMIACDRCDEWYHTQCVNMPDLEVDLVDQFFCPICVKNNPKLRLQTTYKKRCHRGLHTPGPDACTKPARGDLSKYCSDACGVAFMDSRISAWATAGGDRTVLWDSVKGAERREGIAVRTDGTRVLKSTVSGKDASRLGAQLDVVVREREKLKREMDVVVWRSRLVDLAVARAERVEECAWDQRLCFGDEEYAEYGADVLASYGEREDADGMQVDEVEEGEWWCAGKKKCARHSGWQKLRSAEVAFEKEMKEAGLAKLTTRERELRKRIEDLLEPQTRVPPPLQPANGRPAANGARKGKKKRA